ncbi:group 1 truncated hemoglobin [Arenimonas sp.]|uniref:group I truncated hemoglobin n=1 Tax=Arenimonas sp. TaxID=1872635 RepID=UPI0025C0C93D|nr:group 1 truncated hemoglobin [Arenimonas sp.]
MNTLTRLAFALLIAAATPAFAQQPVPVSAEEQAMLDEEARLEAEEAMVEASANANDPTAPNPAPAFPELRPVLDEFGGEAGLTALMETFMVGLLADPRTGPFFANADQVRVKRQLTEQFCVILGGDCTYSGRDMRSSHAGQNIDRSHFYALVEVLQVAMDEHKVPFRAQNKLLAKLAPMHREIVTK